MGQSPFEQVYKQNTYMYSIDDRFLKTTRSSTSLIAVMAQVLGCEKKDGDITMLSGLMFDNSQGRKASSYLGGFL